MRRIMTTLKILAAAAVAASPALSEAQAQAQAQTPAGRPRMPSGPAAAPAPATATPGAAAPGLGPHDPASEQKLNELLRLWEEHSSQVKTLEVKFTRKDHRDDWDSDVYFDGQAVLSAPNRAFLDVKKQVRKQDGKAPPRDKKGEPVLKKGEELVKNPEERIICTGDEVWQYLAPVKQILIYPLAKNERQRALEQGPLPFLFNMKAAEAKRRYKMTYYGEKSDPNTKRGYYVLKIEPLEVIDQDSFKVAMVQLDKQNLQPMQLRLFDQNGMDYKDFWFTETQINARKDYALFFKTPKLEGWKVEYNPVPQGGAMAGAPGAAPGGRAPAPGPRSAQKGAGAMARPR